MTFPYASRDDMIRHCTLDEVVALTNLSDASATTIDEDVLAQGLAGAAEEVDAYVGNRYSLDMLHGLDPAPAMLIKANCVIARKDLDGVNTRESVLEAYRDIIRFLSQITKGMATLNLGSSQPEPPRDSPQFSAPAPVFTRDTLSDYGRF